MDKHVFYFQDNTLNAEKALQGTLKMIAGVDGLSMLVVSADNQVLALESIRMADKKNELPDGESAWPDIFSNQPLLSYTFRTVRAAISVPMATLVPHRLFSPQEYGKYFHLLQPPGPETLYGHDDIKAFGCHLIWGASPAFRQFADRYHPRHIGSVLIQHYQEWASAEGHTIFMNIKGQQAQITVFDQRQLVFYNSFDFTKPTDLLYFVLLVYDQFRLNPEQVPLHATGALLEGSEHYKLLHKYLQRIVFMAPKVLPKIPDGANALPVHYWFDLLSL